ncbi:MAG: hypothetical protein J7K12_02970 [Thermoplasmata archaeon]|nr:hypothetical protein [Thermoplasmata archaeon]
MLAAIKELGHYIKEKEGLDDIQVLTELSKLAYTKKMICVVFKKENDDLIFDGVHIEDFDYEKAKKILFRTFRHGRYNAFLTTIITIKKTNEESIENMKNRWVLWFQKYFQQFRDKYPMINLLKNEIDKKEEDIFKKVLEKYKQFDRENKLGCILTIKIKEDAIEKYPSEVLEFTEIFKETSLEDLYSKHGVIAKGKGRCAFSEFSKITCKKFHMSAISIDNSGKVWHSVVRKMMLCLRHLLQFLQLKKSGLLTILIERIRGNNYQSAKIVPLNCKLVKNG